MSVENDQGDVGNLIALIVMTKAHWPTENFYEILTAILAELIYNIFVLKGGDDTRISVFVEFDRGLVSARSQACISGRQGRFTKLREDTTCLASVGLFEFSRR